MHEFLKMKQLVFIFLLLLHDGWIFTRVMGGCHFNGNMAEKIKHSRLIH
jgi:hypothetical protein